MTALLLLCACGRKEEVVRYVSLDFEAATTKADLPFGDDRITTLDLLVFRQDGLLEYAGHQEGASVRAKLPTGVPFTYFLMANLPAGMFDELQDIDGLAAYSCLLRRAAESGFAMVGAASGTFDAAGTVTVEIAHLSSKVELSGITAAFLQNGLAKLKVTLDKVYLINVAEDEALLSPDAHTPDSWCNRMGLDAGLPPSLRAVLLAEPNLPIPSAETVEESFCFYCAPNRFDNGLHVKNAPEWSPRNTRLVLEMTISGVKNYYPVTLPALRAGYCYRIKNLILLGYGSEHPDEPVGRTRIDFSLSVNSWGIDPEQEELFE